MELVHKLRRKSDGLFWNNKGWDEIGKIFTSTEILLDFLRSNGNNMKNMGIDMGDVEAVSYSLLQHSTFNISEWRELNEAYHNTQLKKDRNRAEFIYEVIKSGKYIDREKNTLTMIGKDGDGYVKMSELLKIPRTNICCLKDALTNFRYVRGGQPPMKVFLFNEDFTAVKIMEDAEAMIEADRKEQEKQ